MLAVGCRTRSETEAEGAAVPEVAHHFLRRRDRRLGRRASRPRRIVFLLKVLCRLLAVFFCQVSGELPALCGAASVERCNVSVADSDFNVFF